MTDGTPRSLSDRIDNAAVIVIAKVILSLRALYRVLESFLREAIFLIERALDRADDMEKK